MINIFEILTVKNKVIWVLAVHDMSKMKEQSWSGIQSFNGEKGGAAGGQQGALQRAHVSPRSLRSLSCHKSTGTIKFLR